MNQGIEIKDLTLTYGDTTIIDGLSATIPAGKITVIMGANGCGKSTLLKSIARILKPVRGAIFLNGKNVHGLDSKLIARQMAVLPQTPKAPEGLTVEELAAFGRFPYKKGLGTLNKEDWAIIEEALAACNLTEFRKHQLAELSGGQRQRAWIAMTLCQKTDVIVLDEPTTYLDLSHQLEILTLLEKLNREENRTIVMVLHELNLASRFADYMIGMKKGKIVTKGTPEEVMTRENLREIFNIEADIVMDCRTCKPAYLNYELASCPKRR